MLICIGLLAVCIFCIVFGSKTEEASVLYYDPPEAERVMMEDDDMPVDSEPPEPDVPAEQPAQEPNSPGDDAALAQSIYNSIEL